MNRTLQTTSLFAFVVALSMVTLSGHAQDSKLDELLQRIRDEQAQQTKKRANERSAIEQRRGKRYKTLMSFTAEELDFALRAKIRAKYEGAILMSAEDEPTYLGTITDKFKLKSIFSDVGPHGSNVARHSIWNEVGRYGGEIGLYSPFSKISRNAPYIMKDRKPIGRLSVNPLVRDRVSPYVLRLYFDD